MVIFIETVVHYGMTPPPIWNRSPRPCSHHAGTKLCRQWKLSRRVSFRFGAITVSSFFFLFLVIQLLGLGVHTVPRRQNFAAVSNSYGYHSLRFHVFSCRYCVNATPKSKIFVSFSNFKCGHRVNGV